MRETAKLIKFHVFFLSVILFLCGPLAHAQEETKKQVLILNSYHAGYEWTDKIVDGVTETLNAKFPNIKLYIEYMDSKRHFTDEYSQQLYDMYRYKYNKMKFDVVICSDDNAFNFLLKHHKKLFPGTPVVFSGVNNFRASLLKGQNQFTGVLEWFDVKQTIEIALKHYPNNTQQIIFMSDKTVTGKFLWKQTQEQIQDIKNIDVVLSDLSELYWSEILEKIQRMPDDSVVLFLAFFRDKSGKYFPFPETFSLISAKCNVPIYGMWEEFLGIGIVGGRLVTGYFQGKKAGEMAVSILNGEEVSNIPVVKESPNRYMFDYTQMKRWGIKVPDLPKDSIVINKPYSFYEENKVLIWCIIAVIIFQMVIIISLLVYRLKRRQAEKELRQTKERYRMVAEQAGQMIYDYNISTGQISWSGDVLAITGFTIDEFQKVDISGWEKLIHPDDRKATLEMLDEAMSKCSNYQVDYRFKHKDGTYLYVEDSGLFLTDKKGNARQMLGIMKDIKERKQAEEALRESEERFRQVVESAEEWVWEIDSSALYTYASPVVEKLLGYKPEEIVGKKHLYDLIHPDDHDATEKEILELFAKKKPFFRFLNRNVHKNGHIVWLSTSGLPTIDEKGKLLGYRGTDVDITERKKAEEELAKHREHLEELIRERTAELEKRVSEVEQLNRAMVNLMEDLRLSNENLETTTHQLGNANKELEAFSYSVSHDLRAPLRSVDGFSQILLEDYSDVLDEKGKHYLERARAGTQKMGQLIDDVLNLSRIGRQAMKMKKINMASIAREVYNSLEDEWKGRKVDFDVHKCPPAAADLNLIQIVFMNLLSNALKFTRNRKTAKIEVGSETKDEQTVFFVKDNGVGFNMKYADKLFSPFQRLHLVEEYEGTGIGLAIVQRIIHRHGGRIWVESEMDVGTTFYFTV